MSLSLIQKQQQIENKLKLLSNRVKQNLNNIEPPSYVLDIMNEISDISALMAQQTADLQMLDHTDIAHQPNHFDLNFQDFCRLIVWQNNLAIRHHLSHVLLVCILNNNTNISDSTKSIVQHQIKNQLRDTDLCTQIIDTSLYVLLPLTNELQANNVHQKIINLKNEQQQPLLYSCRLFTLPTNIDINIEQWLHDKSIITLATR
ncbi:hypothetical protein [Shewanella marina]|uniref:hypothetical protein n=1 Tax=Shewanella marina TaxID=487319 RepID=UPI000472DA54|nr:hypothetical protein [Shewanella marina]